MRSKSELQEKAELVINPINVVTEMDFKLRFINLETRLWFTKEHVDTEGLYYYYHTDIKSHTIGLTYYPNRTHSNYQIWNSKKGSLSGKRLEARFDTELELCVFLKQSKFKIK
jgi:hypothetical protein